METLFAGIGAVIFIWWFIAFKLPLIEADIYKRKHKIDHNKVFRDISHGTPDWMIANNTVSGMYDKHED